MKHILKKFSLILLSGMLAGIAFGFQKKSMFEGSGDIGDCKKPGSVMYNTQTDQYVLQAAGLNIWGEADAFFMTWNKVSGDFSLSADISFEGKGVNAHRKMGIMIREKLTAGSRYADVAIHGDGLTSLQYRKTEGAATAEVVSANKAPDRIYLERKGDKILIKTGKGSLPPEADGYIEMSLPKECYVGLFLCSHEDNVVEKGIFSNVVFKKL